MNISNNSATLIAMDTVFRRIGQGFCGSVWVATTNSGHVYAHKREDGGPGRSLFNDYIMHQKILSSLDPKTSKVAVPRCHQFVSTEDQSWWDEQVSRFPKDFQIRCNVLITDRIPPFAKVVRDAITDIYCPESLKSSIKSSEPNQDCLIRPYLGRRRRLEKQSRFQAFSLRNYPLHVDQMEQLGLDSILYGKIMAEGLADLYWRAHIDANDVEFVLAPTNKEWIDPSVNPTIIKSLVLGDHMIWILDFDCCKPISMDRVGVQQATRAFYRNDPFFPRPGCDNAKDQILWSAFRDHFIKASEAILGRDSPEAHLPELWVRLVEQQHQLEDFPVQEGASICRDANGL